MIPLAANNLAPSTKSPHATARSTAFTLIELLVVIAVIGVLAGIAFPVFNNVIAKSKSAGCISNLRQIGAAMVLYAGDNNNTFPTAYIPPMGWPTGNWNWAINPYLFNKNVNNFQNQKDMIYNGVYRDPGKTDWNESGTNQQAVSYAMNSFDGNSISGVAMRLTNIEHPATTLLVCDTAIGYTVMPNTDYMYGTPCLIHFKKDNVLFCDGHVDAVPKYGFDWNLVLKH